MDKMAVHYSSKSQVWETPQALFDQLNAEHGFTLDVCALPENTKCARYFTPEMDGLGQDWKDNVCWCNPPYGRDIGKWVKKAYESSLMDWQHGGAKVVCLLPARTDVSWWHDYVLPYGKVTFLRGRLRFSGSKGYAPFPNAIVIFDRKASEHPSD